MPTPKPEKKRQGYGKQPPHAYGLISPKFWHGMLPGDLLRLVHRNRWSLSLRGSLSVATALGAGLGHLTGNAVQRALHGRKIDRAREEHPPLFVLGHWRSGTTLLHELLIRDPQHTYPTTYECFCPQHFLVTEHWFTPLTPWLLPKKRPMDNVATGWERPQEDEFALCSLGLPTPYRSWAFPQHGPVEGEWLTLDTVSDKERDRWKNALRRFVATISLKRQGRVILKSPPHTARIKTLLEIFPDARFVHIARDPMLLFPSTIRLWKSLSDAQGLQRPRPHLDWIEEEVLSNLVTMYEAYERDVSLISAGRLVETHYEALVKDPVGVLEQMYRELELGDFERARSGVEKYLAEQGEYRTNEYDVPDEVRQKVANRWGRYADRFGYAS